jgi:hypothetical protein
MDRSASTKTMSPSGEQADVSRRRFLSTSLLAGGAGLGLGEILRLQSQAAERGQTSPDTAVIQIWLGGGPSQFETFDPKPLAPTEIRGPYGSIASKLPGVRVCEMLPLTAAVLDKTAIIRSFTHPYDDHFGVMRWCLGGRRESNNANGYPSLGSIASRYRGPCQPGMPPYVLLSEEMVMHHHLFDANGPGYLGASHSPFMVMQDPYPHGFQSDRLRDATGNLKLADDVTLERIDDRKSLLAELDRLPRQLDSKVVQNELDPFTRLALEMVTSSKRSRRKHGAATDRTAGAKWHCWLADLSSRVSLL